MAPDTVTYQPANEFQVVTGSADDAAILNDASDPNGVRFNTGSGGASSDTRYARSATDVPCVACGHYLPEWPTNAMPCSLCRKPLHVTKCAAWVRHPSGGETTHCCPACIDRVCAAGGWSPFRKKPVAMFCTVTVRPGVRGPNGERFYEAPRPCGKPAVESGPFGAWCEEHWTQAVRNDPVAAAIWANKQRDKKAETVFDRAGLFDNMRRDMAEQFAQEFYGPPLWKMLKRDANGVIVGFEPVKPHKPENTEPFGPPDPGPILRELADIRDRCGAARGFLADYVESIRREKRVLAKHLAHVEPRPTPPKPGRLARARAWLNDPKRAKAIGLVCGAITGSGFGWAAANVILWFLP